MTSDAAPSDIAVARSATWAAFWHLVFEAAEALDKREAEAQAASDQGHAKKNPPCGQGTGGETNLLTGSKH